MRARHGPAEDVRFKSSEADVVRQASAGRQSEMRINSHRQILSETGGGGELKPCCCECDLE